MTTLKGIQLEDAEIKTLREAMEIVNKAYEQLETEDIIRLHNSFEHIRGNLNNFGIFTMYEGNVK